MKICLSCGATVTDKDWRCEHCGRQVLSRDGIPLFAPHISGVTESYDPAWYATLAQLEEKNFWFAARNRVIRWIALQYLGAKGKYLEVGCGTGCVLRTIHKAFPGWDIFATEAQPEGIELARKRVAPGVTFFQMDACAVPFRNEFDAIGAFDVIEHVRDDVAAISQIHAALRPGGIFILSVPQHMFLWSKYDEAGHHFRRYSAKDLERKLRSVNFTVLASISFNSLLLPLMVLSRRQMTKTEGKVDVLRELRLSPVKNGILSAVLQLEFLLVQWGIRFPAGGSRIVVARKNTD